MRWRGSRPRQARLRATLPPSRRGRGRTAASARRAEACGCAPLGFYPYTMRPDVRALRPAPGDVRLPVRGLGLDVARDQGRLARPAAAAVRGRPDGARLPLP